MLERDEALAQLTAAADRPPAQTPRASAPAKAEVLALVAGGLSNAEIARRLFLTPKTVEHHVGAILRKLRVNSRAEAVAKVSSPAWP